MFKLLSANKNSFVSRTYQSQIISKPFAAMSVVAKRFPNEPTKPYLTTAFPGPQTKAFIAEYGDQSCNL